ncbi:U4/U6 small nuclear ribonucleoprotein PRP4-like protein [Hibiscus syriacus]|uniref:U4/U6 small nuclear ribonucleoprotein PRP4-like protein n=1 Tax=Hibiscus syriacus TaxID=106335 RepID=A0A6A3B0H7_HIBSY|nr:U4/U6 small nuclear ribonucleoprotein PRP4-like protein [Hibiscus syriacus]
MIFFKSQLSLSSCALNHQSPMREHLPPGSTDPVGTMPKLHAAQEGTTATIAHPLTERNLIKFTCVGSMDVDDYNSPSNSIIVPDDKITVSTADNTSIQPVQPMAPPVVTPTVVPPIAPIPVAVTSIAPLPTVPPPLVVNPLASLRGRPLVRKPPVSQNGEVKTGDSESDHEDDGQATGGEYEISEESRLVRERQEKAMQDLLMKRRVAALAVPTNDMVVRTRLRRLTHEEEEAAISAKRVDTEEDIEYPFYTYGPKELLDSRIDIAKYSIVKAGARLQRARRKRDDPDEGIDAEIDWALRQAANLVLDCSEIGDDRPLSGCSFSRDGKHLGTWSKRKFKLCKFPVIQSAKFDPLRVVIEYGFETTQATATADRTAKLWSPDGSLLKTFEGHLDRLAHIAFHPSRKYLGTTSFDKTWGLWDIDSGVELLLQEDHSRSVYGIAFHQDGSLVASCGLDALTRVWDLRTRKSILALEGHVKPFEPQEGYYLVTSSYDMTAKVWSGRDFKPVKSLPCNIPNIESVTEM